MEQNVGAPNDAAGVKHGGMMGMAAGAVDAATHGTHGTQGTAGSVGDGYTRDGTVGSSAYPQRVSTSTADYGKPPVTHTAGMV